MTDRALILPFSGFLSLVCQKCTRQERFPGKDRTEAAEAAKAKGWSMPQEQRFCCPRCSRIFGLKGAA